MLLVEPPQLKYLESDWLSPKGRAWMIVIAIGIHYSRGSTLTQYLLRKSEHY